MSTDRPSHPCSARLTFVVLGASLGGCYHGEFLAGQPCTEDRDCGNVLSCNAGVCGDEPPEPSPEFVLSVSPIKQFDFDWAPADRADYYQLLESAEIGAPYVRVGEDVVGLSASLTVPLHLRMSASYKLLACNGNGCSESEEVEVPGSLADAVGYFKASNTNQDDKFGSAVALSADGNTLAVGAPYVQGAGAVYVFVRAGRTWQQDAYVETSSISAGDMFGSSVALSSDGKVLFVGAPAEDSGATGLEGDQADESAEDAGAVYAFVHDGQSWTQQAYFKASNASKADNFGFSLAVAGADDLLAVGAPGEANSGTVYLFVRDSQAGWRQDTDVKASNPDWWDRFGQGVTLSRDGSRLAVGAPGEASNATGIHGDQDDGSAEESGAVYVFNRVGQIWHPTTYVKASNTDAFDNFGQTVALSGDGNTLAISAPREDSRATGIDGDQLDNTAFGSAGAVYVFKRDAQPQWSQQAYVKGSTIGELLFGTSLALSVDGNILFVGAATNVFAAGGGSTNVFTRDAQAQWTVGTILAAPNPGVDHLFGYSVALSGDGNTLAIGATGEDSNATGVGGNQTDSSAPDAGAVYLY